jgi:hypothetical protein
LRPGRYYLRARGDCWFDETWAAQWYDGADSFADATPIEITNEGELVRITMHLVEGGRITGRLLTADGQPATRRDVVLHDEAAEPLCSKQTERETGDISFVGLANGDYYLATHLGDGVYWWYDGTDDPDSAQAISIRDYSLVSGVDWTLPE